MPTHHEMADVFARALEGGDPDGFVAILAPGAIVWHNYDRKEVDARENMASVAILGQLVDSLKSERVRYAAIDGGFLLQFVVHGTVKSNGNAFEMQNCLLVTTTDDGLISRIDEYVDPTVGAQFA